MPILCKVGKANAAEELIIPDSRGSGVVDCDCERRKRQEGTVEATKRKSTATYSALQETHHPPLSTPSTKVHLHTVVQSERAVLPVARHVRKSGRSKKCAACSHFISSTQEVHHVPGCQRSIVTAAAAAPTATAPGRVWVQSYVSLASIPSNNRNLQNGLFQDPIQSGRRDI